MGADNQPDLQRKQSVRVRDFSGHQVEVATSFSSSSSSLFLSAPVASPSSEAEKPDCPLPRGGHQDIPLQVDLPPSGEVEQPPAARHTANAQATKGTGKIIDARLRLSFYYPASPSLPRRDIQPEWTWSLAFSLHLRPSHPEEVPGFQSQEEGVAVAHQSRHLRCGGARYQTNCFVAFKEIR